MSEEGFPEDEAVKEPKAWPEERRRAGEWDEKPEKEEEKEEKGGRDPLSSVSWALIFIAAGLIWLVESMGFIQWGDVGGAWNLVLVAAGLVMLLEVGLRLVMPAYRRPVGGTLVFAFILLAIGIGNMVGSAVVWPLFLIGLGLAIIFSGLLRRSR